jgi:hypothetical protein
MRLLRSIAAGFLLAAPVFAQWLDYPTAHVPRTASGAPDLKAPTPKLADGKPDFSGLWGTMCVNKTVLCMPDQAVPPEFGNIGVNMQGGLPYQPWAADLVKTRKADFGKDDPTTHCLPGGIAKLHTAALLRKIVHTPGLLVYLSERNASYRQIFLDGRPLPKDPVPSWNGYSTGHWEGDILVIETNGVLDRNWLDRAGSPISESAKITERIQRPNYGTLEVDMTVDDPMSYTKPWSIHVSHVIVLDTDLLDLICLENEKDASHLVGAK